MRAQLRKPGACGVLSLEVKYDPASRLKCTVTLIIDDIQYSTKSWHNEYTNLEQFLSRFLVANYIFITRNYNTLNCNFPNATNSTSTTPPWDFNLPRKICMTRDQPRPGSFPISFPEHARSQVKGGHSSGEIELIQACDWLTTDSTLDFQREFYACLAIVAKYK
jgi:hypothetical protein